MFNIEPLIDSLVRHGLNESEGSMVLGTGRYPTKGKAVFDEGQ